MHDREELIVISKAQKIFKYLLLLYPEQYRKKFGYEMAITFEDLYQERLASGKNTGILFLLEISFDIVKNAFEQQINLSRKQGMKKYLRHTLHINTYNLVGIILLLPFFSVFLIDIFSRIAQGDLTRYNRPVYNSLSHTFFYQTPILFIWVILFPAFAVLLNFIPVIQNVLKKHTSVLVFIRQNIVSLVLLLMGLGFIGIIKLHDFGPCVMHGILHLGFGKLPYILTFCSSA